MGYDIECIIDIHTYPGEYFCPVCRTLVFPDEAIQAQCTHLYCKPCLSHIANGTRACPYDNYLVTESDSKPLVESDKVLAENIGKVKVHCLFFRSGCTWQGTVTECNSHCSTCSFGNSAVVCNRCGVQIVHRQVHDHAQTCAGGYEAQQAATGASTTSSITTQTAAAPPLSQAQTTHTTNQQGNVSAQPAVTMPTPEQWYQQQQQYQQYYQQYPGFQPYQQPGQQYFPPQQYQQQPVPVQAQTQSDVHSQPATQLPSHSQTQIAPQIPQQPYFQPQVQPLMPSQTQTQAQVPQPQVAPVQVSHQNYQVNQQLSNPPTRPPQAQTVTSQPHGVASAQQPAPQHVQVPQYHHHKAHLQPQMHPQPLNQPPPLPPQPSNQLLVQLQQHAQSYRPPPQPSQANVPTPLPQIPHSQVPPTSGHHSYQQPQPSQPMMHQMVPHASDAGPLRVPQQPSLMYQPHGSLPQQVPTVVPMQSQVPPQQNQQFPTHVQKPLHPFQQGPAVQPTQQTVPQQYAQQRPFRAPFQGQSHERGHFPHQPMQTRPPYQNPQFQHPQSMGRPMAPNPGVYQQTIPQSGGEAGFVPHSPTQLDTNQTSINQNNAESRGLERNTMEQVPVEKGFEQVPLKKDSTVGQYGTAESGADAKVDGLPSVKQVHSLLEQTSGGKSSEVGTQDGKPHEAESDLSKSSNFLRHESNHDKGFSTESGNQFHIAVSKTNGLRSKLNASTPQRPLAHFSAGSPSTLGLHGPGSREPGYVGPPFEYHSYNKGPKFGGPNGGSVPESSMLGWDEKRKIFGRENVDTLPSNHPSVGLHNRVSNFAPSPEFDGRHMKHSGVRNADREYPGGNSFTEINGREAFHDGKFLSPFGDHMAPRPFNNHSRRDDFLGHEVPPAHSVRQEFGRQSFNGTRNGYSFPHATNFAEGGDSFDLSRKRKPMSAGWCRICRIDCESVEGLDGHSQTREHQNMAMDMVKMIKQQNKMRQLATGGHVSQGGGKVRKVGVDYHGNRP